MFMQGLAQLMCGTVLEILSPIPRCDLKSLFLIGDRKVK